MIQGDRAIRIGQLPYRAKGIAEEVLRIRFGHLLNAIIAIQVGICAIIQHLGQVGSQVHSEGGGHPVYRLLLDAHPPLARPSDKPSQMSSSGDQAGLGLVTYISSTCCWISR